MNTIDSKIICRDCGTRLPSGPLAGMCPACLLESTLDAEAPSAAVSHTFEPPVGGARLPWRFGRYEVMEEISRGGAGVVFRARDEGLRREVALKFLRAGALASRDDTRRLFLEARAAARLNHPSIVPVFEVGGADDPQPFLAMAFLPGGTLAQRLKQGGVSPRDAARWLAAVARAVHHAHQHGILHRDLKPGNILFDAAGEPMVADFGLARLLDEDHTLTRTDAVLGTPAYLAPEQAAGRAGEITTAADIHALGAILYEVLTGRPPFAENQLPVLLRQIAEATPTPPRQINSSIPRDLETICLKCLEKEPAKRYATAQELANELDRFLNDEPIHARPVSRVERTVRWCRRKPALAGALGAAGLFLVAGFAGILWQWREARHHATRAESNAATAREAATAAAANALQARRAQYASDMNLAHQAVQDGDFSRARQLLERHRPTINPGRARLPSSPDFFPGETNGLDGSLALPANDLRGFEWHYLWRETSGDPHVALGAHTNSVMAVGLLPAGRTAYSVGKDQTVRFWDLASRQEVGVLPHDEPVWGGVPSPDGRWFVSVTLHPSYAQTRKNVRLWDLPSRREVAVLFTNVWPRPRASLAISPDSRHLAFIDQNDPERLVLCELPSGREVRRFPAQTDLVGAQGVTFTPAGSLLAYSANLGGDVALIDTRQWIEVGRLTGHKRNVNALAVSPDGQWLASVSLDRTLRLWNLRERRAEAQPVRLAAGSGAVAFSPDGRALAVADGAGITLRRVPDLSQARELRWRSRGANCVAFVSDQELLAGGENGSVVRFDLRSESPGFESASIPHGLAQLDVTTGPALAVAPDASHVLAVFTNDTFQIWSVPGLKTLGPLPLPTTNFSCAAISARGETVAFADLSGNTLLWHPVNRTTTAFGRPQTNGYGRMAFSSDGRKLAFAGWKRVSVWDASSRHELGAFDKPPNADVATMWLGFSPDANALAVAQFTGEILYWRLNQPGPPATLRGHVRQVNGFAFAPDGKTLVTASGDVRLWNLETATEVRRLGDLPGFARFSAFSPDGRRLAIGNTAGDIAILDYPELQEVMRFRAFEDSIFLLGFTADGKSLVAASISEIRVWRADIDPKNSTFHSTSKGTTP